MRSLLAWLGVGWAAVLLLPWYGIDGVPRGVPELPAVAHALWGGRVWLLPLLVPLLLASWAAIGKPRPRVLVIAGIAGIAYLVAEGLLIIHHGWAFAWLTDV